MERYAFGVDLGGTTVKIGLFDTEGMLLEKWEIPTRTEDGGSQILPDIAKALLQKLEEKGVSTEHVVGIGMGAPGAVRGGNTVNRCANLGWGVVNVAEELRALTGVDTIRVANDANVAALGEMWKGGAKGHRNVVMVTLGTGVGGGIIVDEQIVEGAFGAGGEIGHIVMNPEETEHCGCGGRGHLEQYASATGVVRLATNALRASDRASTLRSVSKLTAKSVFDAAKAEDALALEIVETMGDVLGRALAMISCVADPEIYVIGGGVSKAGAILLDAIREHFRKYAFHASRSTEFALAQLGNDAGMYGAVRMVMEQDWE